MKGRSKRQEPSDRVSSGHPSRSIKKRRGRGKQNEKKRMNEETPKQTIDDIKFNKKVMSNLQNSGAINYLLAGMFTQLSVFANQRRRKRSLIASDFKSFIKPEKNKIFHDYSDDYSDDDTVQERNRIKHLIASRIVYEYIIDHHLKLTKYALQNETKNDKAFSSKTPASLSPLQLDEFEDEDDTKNNIIMKIITANKRTNILMKPPSRKHEIDIITKTHQQRKSQLQRKNTLNSDISLETESYSSADYEPTEEEEEEDNEPNKETPNYSDNGSNSTPLVELNTPPKSSSKLNPPPSTTSPKRKPPPPIDVMTPPKTLTPSNKTPPPEKVSPRFFPSDPSSNFETDDDELINRHKAFKQQSPTHAKNELSTMDLSPTSGDPNFNIFPNSGAIAKSTSSQANQEIPALNQNNDSRDDSLNESSGSEHELQAEYSSDRDDE